MSGHVSTHSQHLTLNKLPCPGLTMEITASRSRDGTARAPGSSCLAPKLAAWEQIQLLEGTAGLEGTVASSA